MSQTTAEYFAAVPAEAAKFIQRAKKQGQTVLGHYCEYVPREVVLAAGAYPTCLCSGRFDMVAPAEAVLPPSVCPLVKSSFGFVLTDQCPFFEEADLIVAETTCDGKKKMFEYLAAEKPPGDVHLMDLPQKPAEAAAFDHWLDEVRSLASWVEGRTGVAATEDRLRDATRLMNRERQLLRRLFDFSRGEPAYLTGMEALNARPVVSGDERYYGRLEEFLGELEERRARGEGRLPGAKRVLLTGVPTVRGAQKVPKLLEESGALVVVNDTCTGLKSIDRDVPEDAPHLLAAIARRYLDLPCSCMTPNPGRLDLLDRAIEGWAVQGVVDLTWKGCHTYNIEAYQVGARVRDRWGLPYLHIESDYGESDLEQLRVRVETFVEML